MKYSALSEAFDTCGGVTLVSAIVQQKLVLIRSRGMEIPLLS
jgi:hypothetical protein